MAANESALALARRLARDVAREHGLGLYPEDPYGVHVRTRAEAAEHGWMRGALATVTIEDSGVDLIEWTGREGYATDRFYFEAYSTYMVGVYAL